MTSDRTLFGRLDDVKTRVTLTRPLGKYADGAVEAIIGELAGLTARPRHTITYDNGAEFSRHEQIAE